MGRLSEATEESLDEVGEIAVKHLGSEVAVYDFWKQLDRVFAYERRKELQFGPILRKARLTAILSLVSQGEDPDIIARKMDLTIQRVRRILADYYHSRQE